MLQRVGLYHRVKSSWIYDCYWKLADGQVIADRQKEEAFYRDLLKGLREGDLIFDRARGESQMRRQRFA